MNLELTRLIIGLFTVYRAAIDDATCDLYLMALEDIPLPLVKAAIAFSLKERRRQFLPLVPELLDDIDEVRRRRLAEIPHQPCAACTSPGWTEIKDGRGVKRVTRCACWLAWQDGLRASGLLPVAISPASGDARQQPPTKPVSVASMANALRLTKTPEEMNAMIARFADAPMRRRKGSA